MAAPVEGWAWERIEKEHGTLDRLLPYEHYRNGWRREPGTTEDGVERQKLIITAIIEKKDRVTAEDVRAHLGARHQAGIGGQSLASRSKRCCWRWRRRASRRWTWGGTAITRGWSRWRARAIRWG